MEANTAILALAALAQTTRLDAFRLLISHEPDGMAAGDLAQRLAVPANTLSAHLAVLARAGLVSSERRSRSIIYRADIIQVRSLVLFLLADCCGGRADRCEPLLAELLPCCP
jgi:ArsR family transcriptional regulator, arsenate/arsenite/antimonite-responsive transcriptional repressor